MYELVELCADLLNDTESSWNESLSSDDIPFSRAGYDACISYSQSILENPKKHQDTKLYAVRNCDDNFAAGIITLSIVHPRTSDAYIKILSTRTSPRLDSRWGKLGEIKEPERLRKVSRILVAGLVQIYQLSCTESSDLACQKIKIFSNKQVDKALFMNFMSELEHNSATSDESAKVQFELESYGAWLEIIKKDLS